MGKLYSRCGDSNCNHLEINHNIETGKCFLSHECGCYTFVKRIEPKECSECGCHWDYHTVSETACRLCQCEQFVSPLLARKE